MLSPRVIWGGGPEKWPIGSYLIASYSGLGKFLMTLPGSKEAVVGEAKESWANKSVGLHVVTVVNCGSRAADRWICNGQIPG